MQRSLLLVALLTGCLTLSRLHAQNLEPPEPAPSSERPTGDVADDAVDVLTRGPLHEAFAEQVAPEPMPGVVIDRQPPDPIDEVPPEFKPDGDNVQWISGYWFWDDEREDFLWISGVWREPPPGRRWVPGYWQQVEASHQWISGFWAEAAAGALDYIQPPPQTLEVGPSSAAPSDNYFWVPGCWNYSDSNYRWRPGYWYPYQTDWVWVPARYVWTPRGCIYVNGYWDYPFKRRGYCFAPVSFRRQVYLNVGYTYRPSCVLDDRSLLIHLFVRPNYGHYYFGDYYDGRYAQRHYYPCHSYHHRYRGYDPLFGYYDHHFRRQGIDYSRRVRDWHDYYQRHVDVRPPHTLRGQSEFLARHSSDRLAQTLVGKPFDQLLRLDGRDPRWQRLEDVQQREIREDLRQMREISSVRRRVEGQLEELRDDLERQRDEVRSRGQLQLPRVADPRLNRSRREATPADLDRIGSRPTEQDTLDRLRRRGVLPEDRLPGDAGRGLDRARAELDRLRERGLQSDPRIPQGRQEPGRSDFGRSGLDPEDRLLPDRRRPGSELDRRPPVLRRSDEDLDRLNLPGRERLDRSDPPATREDLLRRLESRREEARDPRLPQPRIEARDSEARRRLDQLIESRRAAEENARQRAFDRGGPPGNPGNADRQRAVDRGGPPGNPGNADRQRAVDRGGPPGNADRQRGGERIQRDADRPQRGSERAERRVVEPQKPAPPPRREAPQRTGRDPRTPGGNNGRSGNSGGKGGRGGGGRDKD